MTPKFKRILLKLSGETLGGEQGTGFEYDTIRSLADSVVAVHNLGLEVGIVVGNTTPNPENWPRMNLKRDGMRVARTPP